MHLRLLFGRSGLRINASAISQLKERIGCAGADWWPGLRTRARPPLRAEGCASDIEVVQGVMDERVDLP